MGWQRWWPVATGVLLAAAASAPRAHAADVSFACCSYAPSSVRIAPGGAVTWSGDFSQHPLRSRDGESETFGPVGTGSAFTHAYPSAGVFHYFCTIHGASQTSGMIGTVVVTANQPPVAALSGPDVADAGSPVTWDASGSSDPDGVVTRYEWDLDGDGSFETDTGFMPTVSRTYPSAGTVTVRVRVTDDNADAVGPERATASHSLTVRTAPGGGTPPAPGGGTSGTATGPAPGGGGAAGGGGSTSDGGTTPGGGAPSPPPAAALSAPRSVRLGALRRRGLAVRVRARRAGTMRATLRAGGRTLATARRRVAAGRTTTVRLRLTRAGRRALAHLRRASATLRVAVPGLARPLTRRVVLRR